MFSRFHQLEAAVCARLGWRALSGIVEHSAFWLLPFTVVLLLLDRIPGPWGWPAGFLVVFIVPWLAVVLAILVYRWVTRRLFWAVRNRIIVTFLLMGLAPLVLVGSLTSIAAYVFAGQFATNSAVAALDASLEQVRDRVATYGAPAARALEHDPAARLQSLAAPALSSTPHGMDASLRITAWQDGKPLPVGAMGAPAKSSDSTPLPPPAWLHPGFSGVVQDGGRLFLRATAGYRSPQHSVLVLASVPLDREQLATLAQGLGLVRILPVYNDVSNDVPNEVGQTARQPGPRFAQVQGGSLPPPAHFFDTRVFFSAPLHIADWQTGGRVGAFLGVVSRPTLLYNRLFSTSVSIGNIVRDVLFALALFFLLLQLLALYMASRLSRTITQSVASLYQATTEIDRGNLMHRVPVKRHDQLAALATSFNTMAASLGQLLAAQREQERMQSELAIAQEVQKNWFPHTPIGIPGLELHGICKPARTVSGDYYDFILNGGSELCVAIGDISGKGISAALLMASLHSAIRAHLVAGKSERMPSPALLLSLLNRHLYASTQPEKYATLFLACYQTETRELVYANGGQLPPYLICADGTTHALDRGGSVVGLLDGMEYEEGRVQLSAGDLLVAYSDGVTEPENDFGEFGSDRLLALVRQHRHLPLHAISAHTMRELANWIGEAEQPDDITLVLARQV